MTLSNTERMLLDRGWHFHGNYLWAVEIGGRYYGFNTDKGVLTTHEGFINGDRALPNLVQRPCDFTSVLALGFSDYWHEPKERLDRERMKLEHLYHL